MNFILDKLTSNPKVTIITVCFNSEKTIKYTIESVLSQDYKNIEYIIVDADSCDKTKNIIQQFEDKISLFICEKDNGIYDGMNKGIKNSTGEIIGILNSDDIYSSKNVISEVVKKMSNFNTGTLYADLIYVNKNNFSRVVRYWKSGDFSISKLKSGWMLPHPTFFVRKEIYENYGLYDNNLKKSSDYEMVLRLLYKYNVTTQYLPKIIIKMRLGGVSNKNLLNRFLANSEDLQAWRNNIPYRPFLIRFIKPFVKIYQFFNKPTKKDYLN